MDTGSVIGIIRIRADILERNYRHRVRQNACRLIAVLQHIVVDDKPQGQDQCPDDGEVELPSGDLGDALPSSNVAFEFDPVGRDLVSPRENQGYGKPQNAEKRTDLDDSIGGFKDGQDGGRNLDQYPSDNGIGHCDFNDVASFQLPEE